MLFTNYLPAKQNSRSVNSKVPPEMIQHFKNTAELPRKAPGSKQNQNPKTTLNPITDSNPKAQLKTAQSIEPQKMLNTSKMMKTKVVQADINKIADSYVLQGNFLKKRQVFQQALKKGEKKKTTQNQKQNIHRTKPLDRKQILKLEYLQKMGFLRPDQKQILAQYRQLHPQMQIKQETTGKKQQLSNYKQEQNYGNFYNYYSPKHIIDPKKPTHFFSSSSKFMYPGQYQNY